MAQFFQLLLGRPPAFKGVNQQFAGRSFKHALQDVAHKLALGFRRRLACFIDVRALAFVSPDGAFGGHNLQEL
jgi:hypothetical protein